MNATTLAGQYFAMWNEADADARSAIISKTWAPEGSFVDPSFEVSGYDGLNKLVGTAQQMFPGHAFSVTGEIQEHHNRLRWTWHLAAEGQEPVAGGTDVVTLAPDGRIHEVIGFLDFAPAH
ncbi:nuclear transport factor 2 family protein [Kribbella catacumbae]|uniref:nuclear transport factor 2 family protein n=1 Tax=Kribbella catacumbae TaxID=460086 RepID=UPI000365851B|nr:nuclear transport factor 2 family protein [Kribbella catacumbae]